MPMVGPLVDMDRARDMAHTLSGAHPCDMPRLPGLFCAIAFASRGLAWTALAAECVASQLEREPLPLEATLVIHRYGRLEPGERIVLVVTASGHRAAAFEACEFLVDWLKTKAPFWKLEETPQGERWVEAQSSDDQAAKRWVKS